MINRSLIGVSLVLTEAVSFAKGLGITAES